MKKIMMFIILSSSLSLFGQSRGKIVNELGEYIPYAIITWNNGLDGVVSDSLGVFIINENSNLNDTISISAIGYKDINIRREYNMSIVLDSLNYELPQINITSTELSSKKEKFKIRKRKLSTMSSCSNYSFAIGTSFKNDKEGYLNKVSIFFNRKGHEDNSIMRLRIFRLTENGLPSYNILNSNLLLKPSKKGWYHINLMNYGIELNGFDFLIAIEWLSMPNKTLQEDCIKQLNKRWGIGMTEFKEEDNVLGWDKKDGGKWYNFDTLKLKGPYNKTPLIRAEANLSQ